MKKIVFLMLIHCSALGKSDHQNIEQLKIGNLALPNTQQLAPLFCVGQLVIEKGSALALFSGEHSKGSRIQETSLTPALLYGITNDLSVFINIPIAVHIKSHQDRSSGLGDLFAQFEYAVYTKDEYTYSNQATLIGTIIVPTGSSTQTPHTGSGSTGFFLGGTYSHLATDWYYFTSGGCLLTTKKHLTKPGNEFLYQGGFGRNLGNPWGCIFTCFFECHGTYKQRTKINNHNDQNSGRNTIYLGPTLWLSSRHFIAETGITFPIVQQLNGKQNKFDYTFAFNLAWTFA